MLHLSDLHLGAGTRPGWTYAPKLHFDSSLPQHSGLRLSLCPLRQELALRLTPLSDLLAKVGKSEDSKHQWSGTLH